MTTPFVLVLSVLVAGQTVVPADWNLAPRINRGQELLYKGSYREETFGKGVEFRRDYRLEVRLFVMDTTARGADVAFMTVLRQRKQQVGRDEPLDQPEDATEEEQISSVRLERATLDSLGSLTAAPGTVLLVPLDGPPTVETGPCVETPSGQVGFNQTWVVPQLDRPVLTYRVDGSEAVNGTSCVKLLGVQQSDDWDRPRADHVAWRRRETVWMSPRFGVAQRVERCIERREPARREPSQRLTTRYELESTLLYPGQLFEERRRDILLARSLAEAAAPLLPNASQHGRGPFETLLSRARRQMEDRPPTPYRAAVLQMTKRLEGILHGDVAPPVLVSAELPPVLVTIGQNVPDAPLTDLSSGRTVLLRNSLGRPIVLIFFNPSSPNAAELLRCAQQLASQSDRVTVYAVLVGGTVGELTPLKTQLGLTIPIYWAEGLRSAFAVETTPRLLVLDAKGTVRGDCDGWGKETVGKLNSTLSQCLAEPPLARKEDEQTPARRSGIRILGTPP